MDVSNLNENLVAGLFTLATVIGGWLWKKAHGEKTRSISELLDEAITAEVVDALEDGETLATIEKRLTGAAMTLGGKLGVKLPKQTVNVAVQWGVVEFRQALKVREANQKAAKELSTVAGELLNKASGVLDAFDSTTTTTTVPKLDITVEVIK